MVIGVLEIELVVPWSESLKDKRRVVRSLKDQLRRRFVAVAEVGNLDALRTARLAVVCVGAEGRPVADTLDRIAAGLADVRDGEASVAGRVVFRLDDVPESRRFEPDPALAAELLARGTAALDPSSGGHSA